MRGMNLSKRYIFVALVAIAVISTGIFSLTVLPWENVLFGGTSGQITPGMGHSIVDLSDDRNLVGFAQNVFIGQVEEKLKQTEEYGYPETQYRVRVIEQLKGSLSAEVTVNQQGGEWDSDGSAYRMGGDPELLETGKTYLFATRYFSEESWHTVMPGYGNIKIQVTDNASDSIVVGSAHTVELRERFTTAITNEISYNPSNPKASE